MFLLKKLYFESKEIKYAIVHDWFLSKSIGGAEKVTKVIYEIIAEMAQTEIFSIVQDLHKSKNEPALFLVLRYSLKYRPAWRINHIGGISCGIRLRAL